MTPQKKAALALLEGLVAQLVERGAGEDEIAALVDAQGGRMQFRGGTHEIRLGGVSGTGTEGYEAAMKSWLRAAKRKLGDEQ